MSQNIYGPAAVPTAYDNETCFPRSVVPGTLPVTHRSELYGIPNVKKANSNSVERTDWLRSLRLGALTCQYPIALEYLFHRALCY